MKFKNNSVNYLVGINLAVFMVLYLSHPELEKWLPLYFPENSDFRWWQPFTHLFIHANFMHIFFNMYALFAFGNALESIWGKKKFLTFYFVSGLGAALIYSLANYVSYLATYNDLSALGMTSDSIQQIQNTGSVRSDIVHQLSEQKIIEFYQVFHSSAVGASGAIYGILIAFAMTFPEFKLILIFFPIPIKARYFVPIVIAGDLFFGVTKYSIGNIAHFAHIGGALFGFLMMLWWGRGRNQQMV